MDHRQIVATAFRVISLALGIPSTVASVFLSWSALRLHLSTPQLGPATSSGDQLIDLLVSGARIFGKLMSFLGGAGKWFITVLAMVSLLSVALAALLFLTARGLQAGRLWARIVGILLTLATLLISLGALTTGARLVSAILAIFSLYAIWTLAWRFS